MGVLRRVAGWMQEGSLYVLLLLLPFSKAAIEVTFGILLIGWILERICSVSRFESLWFHPSFRALRWMLAAYLAACALSIVVSDYPLHSVKGFVDKWLEYLLMMVIGADVACRPGVVPRCLKLIAWSSVLVLIEAASQQLTGQGLLRHYPFVRYGRMTGPYENPIDLATYLMVVIPILLGWWMTLRGKSRVGIGMLLLLLLGLLGKTRSTGAWLGLAFGLAVFIVLDARSRRYGLLIIGMLALVGVSALQRIGRSGRVVSAADIGTADRLAIWQAAVQMIKDRPLLGHGLNTFMANYLKYWVAGEHAPRYAHNCYLQVAAETGVIGLVLFVGCLVTFFAQLLIALRRITEEHRLILLGFFAGLLAFVLQAGIDTNFYSLRQATLFWMLAGLALGLSYRSLVNGSS